MWSEYIVLDIETTGLSPHNGGEICKVEALNIKGGVITEPLNTLVQVINPIPEVVTEITGISNRELLHAPSSLTVCTKLRELIGTKVVISHNASFVKLFLDAQYEVFSMEPNAKYFCTKKFAKAIFSPEVFNCTSDALLKKFGVDDKKIADIFSANTLDVNFAKERPMGLSELQSAIKIFIIFTELMKLKPLDFDFSEYFF